MLLSVKRFFTPVNYFTIEISMTYEKEKLIIIINLATNEVELHQKDNKMRTAIFQIYPIERSQRRNSHINKQIISNDMSIHSFFWNELSIGCFRQKQFIERHLLSSNTKYIVSRMSSGLWIQIKVIELNDFGKVERFKKYIEKAIMFVC